MIPFLDLRTQFEQIETEVREAMDRVLKRSWYVLGEELLAFEEEFAAYLGSEFVVGVGSGTDALHLALAAAGVGPGDEVITAANTCVPTLSAISATGARVVFVDIDAATYTLCAESARGAVSERTKAIVPVHLYGHSADLEPLMKCARESNVAIVEDCAQAHGARYRDQRCGTIGTASAFSFYPSKNLGAYGDGGAIATNDEAVAEKARMLRNYGQRERYTCETVGFNSRLDELQAAVLRVKLRYLDGWNDARRARAQAYDGILADTAFTLPHEADWTHHVYHLFVVRHSARDALRAFLKENGVASEVHYPVPAHLQPGYAHLGYEEGAFPLAEAACREVLSLPMYPELPMDDLNRVGEVLRRFSL